MQRRRNNSSRSNNLSTMIILTLNVGSSSVKYSLYKNKKNIQQATFNKIYDHETRLWCIKQIKENLEITPNIIVHRIVHGRDIKKTSFINKELLKELKKASELAPLHVKPQIEVIKYTQKLFKSKQIAVFDTSFHSTIPEHAKIYGLPYKYYEKGIKKYGFHGINHKYVSKKYKGKVISLHLGSGCSITAIKNKKSIDTTMGFTPLDGLLMTTRSGSLDPSIIPFMIEHEKVEPRKIIEILNKESGLLGISEESRDMKELLESKKPKAKLAIKVFLYKINKEIGAMINTLQGINTIIFTGGIGENSPYIRQKIIQQLTYLGAELDQTKNKQNQNILNSKKSKIQIVIEKANEELEMINEAIKLCKNSNKQ